MTQAQTFVEPAKVKMVTAITNVSLGEAELGELYFDLSNNGLYIRTTEGWKSVTFS